MTLEQFADLSRQRIPTPREFLDFAQGQGWSLSMGGDGKGHLTVPGGANAVAKALARMLSREPYRTGVLAELQAEWRRDRKPESLPALRGREWLWRTGHTYKDDPADEWLYGQAERHAAGALWWRPVGETEWRRIEGRGDPSYQIPEVIQ